MTEGSPGGRDAFRRGRSLAPAPALFALACAALACAALACSALAETRYFEERLPQCIGCHGEAGVSETPETPSLGGLDDFYALIQLVAFRERNRKNEIMNEMIAEMTDDDLRAAAQWVDGLPRPPAPPGPADPDRMAAGKALVSAHRCNVCHGADLLGGHQMPPLRNQRQDYLEKALHDYRAERRFGDRAAMVEVAQALSDQQIADLAYYLAQMK